MNAERGWIGDPQPPKEWHTPGWVKTGGQHFVNCRANECHVHCCGQRSGGRSASGRPPRESAERTGDCSLGRPPLPPRVAVDERKALPGIENAGED
jgi:hypothetical protein